VVERAGRVSRRAPTLRYKTAVLRRMANGASALGAATVLPTEMKNGTRILLDARGRTEAGPFWNGVYDQDEVDFFVAVLEPRSTMVDVGANVGLIALQVANSLAGDPQGRRVLAVEPMPVNSARLCSSLGLVEHYSTLVQPVSVALGEDEGFLELRGETSGSSNAGLSAAGFCRGVPAVVRRLSLDALLAELGITNVGLVKIDAEGYDCHVVAGAVGCLSEMRPILHGEFHNEFMPRLGRTFHDVVDIVRPLGYRFFTFRGRLNLVEVASPSHDAGNMVLVPEERVASLAGTVSLTQAGPRS